MEPRRNANTCEDADNGGITSSSVEISTNTIPHLTTWQSRNKWPQRDEQELLNTEFSQSSFRSSFGCSDPLCHTAEHLQRHQSFRWGSSLYTDLRAREIACSVKCLPGRPEDLGLDCQQGIMVQICNLSTAETSRFLGLTGRACLKIGN